MDPQAVLDHRVNVDPPEEEVFLDLMDHQDPKVKVVMLALLVYLALRDVKVTLDHQVCPVVKVSGDQQVFLVLLANQVVPVTVDPQVLMAKLVNKVLRVSKVSLVQWDLQEDKDAWVNPVKMVLLVTLVQLVLVVTQVKMVLRVLLVPLDQLVLLVNVVPLAHLDPEDSKVSLVQMATLVLQEKTAREVSKAHVVCPVV